MNHVCTQGLAKHGSRERNGLVSAIGQACFPPHHLCLSFLVSITLVGFPKEFLILELTNSDCTHPSLPGLFSLF
jgi:hypothetical protein